MTFIQDVHIKLKSNSKLYWFIREQYVVFLCILNRLNDKPTASRKKRILFYGINSLSHGGTEKMIQILARHTNKDLYDVYFLYPDTLHENPGQQLRYKYVQSGGATLIPFTYNKMSVAPPHFVSGMNPDIKNFIQGLQIDTLIVAGPGCADYPFSIIKDTPIILLNIFGQANMQKNISYHLCLSKEIANKITPIVPTHKIDFLPVPSEGPTNSSPAKGVELRKKYNIPDTEIVFGRIGRAVDNIHDPIGIEAFKIALKTRTDIHFLIMSPPPKLVRQVEEENIPNVYFVEPSSDEEDIWAFHAAIDTLAHFRLDGESFGLNIAESMLSGNPIISHKSHIWNAQLEYLDASFSRIAEKDDSNAYAAHMLEFTELHNRGALNAFGENAKLKGEALFHIKNNIARFEKYVKQSIK